MERNITIEVESKVQWLAVHSKHGTWIATCDSLGLALEGDSLDELHELIKEAFAALFVDLLKDNEFDEFLRARGWQADLPEVPGENVNFEIPWNLVADGQRYGTERQPH